MRKVCEVYLVSSASSDERGVELTFPVSQYEMMDAFEQIHTKSPGDVYWQVDEFYCFDYLAPHLDESMSIFEFNSLTEQLSKLDGYQETALEGLLQMQVDKHMQESSGIITVPELMMLASNVDRCHVLAEVHTNEDLGKFYADNDFLPELNDLPDSVYNLLDYAKIGKQMREDESGVFTPHGYVVRTEELEPLPEHEPQPGQAPSAMASAVASSIFPDRTAAGASNAFVSATRLPFTQPGSIGPPEQNMDGMFSRRAAISIPGTILSQFGINTRPSNGCAVAIISTESAMCSRLGRE